MGSKKDKEAHDEALPSYEDISGPSSFSHAGPSIEGPSVASPFNFPSDADSPPSYSAPSGTDTFQRPIAIPQVTADPKSPFLDAYAQLLLQHGITDRAWAGFLRTLSGFLSATVSEKTVSHAADMAQHVGEVPKRFGKATLAHAKETGRAISDSAKTGDFIGAAWGVVGGAIALPVATSIRAVGAAVALPFAALDALGKKPRTPRERAVAYTAAANLKWLHRRGLEAQILDTTELSQILGLPVTEMLRITNAAKDASAVGQIAALGAHIAELEVHMPATIELEPSTFWLVVTQRSEGDESTNKKGKGKNK
ncbi:hypothetical protein AAE478_009439 [Parahypoxylon ruwenzoriense]